MNPESLRYAGFWPRLCSLVMDFVVLLPIALMWVWGGPRFHLFYVYYFLPGALLDLFYHVYLVRRFGSTPGKLLVGIRIRKLNGESVGYREAFLRYFPDFVFGRLVLVAVILSVLQMSDAEYHSGERHKRMIELAPSWYKPLQRTQAVWFWSELIVLLTNRKRRALHDFIAGTVVVHTTPAPSQSLQTAAATPVS